MNNLRIFDTLPQGFKFIETPEDREKLARTISHAFGGIHYPIPTCEMSTEDYQRLYYELGLRWIDNALEKGAVISNEDFTGTLILTKMHDALDSGTLLKEDPAFSFLPEDARKCTEIIFSYTYEDEKYLEFDPENDIYIEIFAVRPDKQGQKIGSKLMRELFKECDKAKKDVLLLTSLPPNAVMYEHFGFRPLYYNYKKEIDSHAFYLKRMCKHN